MLEVERMIRLNSLKSKGNQKNTFASLNFNIERERDWKLSPRERFKRLNEWRIHTPTITERKNLKIPITIDKIDLLEISHFLILSGGNNHMEFSIQEMDQIEKLHDGLINSVNAVRDTFYQLSPHACGHHLNSYHIKHFQEEKHDLPVCILERKSFLEGVLQSLHIHSSSSSSSSLSSSKHDTEKVIELHSTNHDSKINSHSSDDSHIDLVKQPHHEHTLLDSVLETLHLKPIDEPNQIEQSILHFHVEADILQKHLFALQKILIRKYHQKPIHRIFHDQLENVDFLPEDWWLQILIKKYKKEILSKEENERINEEERFITTPTPSSVAISNPLSPVGQRPHPYLPPITLFSIFLSFCLIGEFDCTKEEEDALFKLLHISRDYLCHQNFNNQNQQKIYSLIEYRDCIYQHTQQYWIARIFDTLAGVADFDLHPQSVHATEIKYIRDKYFN